MAWPSCPQCKDYMDMGFCTDCSDVVWTCCEELIECEDVEHTVIHAACIDSHRVECAGCEEQAQHENP